MAYQWFAKVQIRAPQGLSCFALKGDGTAEEPHAVTYEDGKYILDLTQKPLSVWYELRDD